MWFSPRGVWLQDDNLSHHAGKGQKKREKLAGPDESQVRAAEKKEGLQVLGQEEGKNAWRRSGLRTFDSQQTHILQPTPTHACIHGRA